MTSLSPPPGEPTPPIALAHGSASASAHLSTDVVELDQDFLTRLSQACSDVTVDAGERAEHSRDWWPLAMIWATQGKVPAIAGAVVRPKDTDEVSAVLKLCNDEQIPVTASGGRSGVLGAAVPVFGGVVLDMTAMSGIVDVDTTSMVLDVLPGTFGDAMEATLAADHRVTVGHWPQSMSLATVGGWLACRSAGQYSTRYGKIEDMVVGLEVVLANGSVIQVGGHSKTAVGPDLTQLFVGSEGTLGVITKASLRLHPAPVSQLRSAFTFDSFADGLEACRVTRQRGATPAVMRLHDVTEADRFGVQGKHLVLIFDEGDPEIIGAAMRVAEEVCATTGTRLDDADEVVGKWLEHRNDVASLEALITRGYVVDTMEVTGSWTELPEVHRAVSTAIGSVAGTMVVSCHQSHAYTDGACLYFTFAAKVEPEERDGYYLKVWDAGTNAALEAGASLSHHHGVGLNRSRFVQTALGSAYATLEAIKASLDPHGILNPGKFGFPSTFGTVPWP